MKFTLALILLLAIHAASACELCAIYNSDNALGASSSGLSFNVAEQYVPYRTRQDDGQNPRPATSYVDSSMTHLVPAYNFSSRFGVSLSVPLVYLNFRRTDLRYSLTAPPVLFTERGTESGLGDASLIGRVTAFKKSAMDYGVLVNVLGGVKFPTGNDERLVEEVEQAKIFEALGGPHDDPLSHSISTVHQHSLALGSGSYDGIFGLTVNGRWLRWIMNGQLQYYLRTEGESGFKYGDELTVSGGPGVYVLLKSSCTLSLQANAVYDWMARDELLGRPSNQTGLTAWYLGPLLNFTWGEHFSANAGVDVPLIIDNNGRQSVPNYRIHCGFSWRF
jgi:hypothetical protein